MSAFRLGRLWDFLASMQLVVAVFWLGLALFTISVAILMYSRWGQNRPLRKCMALSLFAHLLLAGYATTIQVLTPAVPIVQRPFVVSLRDVDSGDGEEARGQVGGAVAQGPEQPWEMLPQGPAVQTTEPQLTRSVAPDVKPQRRVRAEGKLVAGGPQLTNVGLVDVRPPEPKMAPFARESRTAAAAAVATLNIPAAQQRAAPQLTMPHLVVSRDGPQTPKAVQPVRKTVGNVPLELTQAPTELPRVSESAGDWPEQELAATVEPLHGAMRRERIAPHIAAQVDAASAGDDLAYADNTGAKEGSRTGAAEDATRIGAENVWRDGQGGGSPGGSPVNSNAAVSLAPGQGDRGDIAGGAIPDAYRLRLAPNHAGAAEHQGGSAASETAVKTALKWFAAQQEADGHWNPRAHGAGRDNNVLGHDHQNAGSHADTGMTGLALLAFLAAGHTHRDGDYREEVRRALEYLLRMQGADGNLGGQARMYEFMYCHGMAACALSEAYGMTHDKRLREPVERAIGFTLAAQDPVGGGWRYKAGMPGDTSQLGWQVMALKSADLAGIPIAEESRRGIIRFLQSVSYGDYGGKASYRPGEQVTRTMSAEALVCWQFLGLSHDHPACSEAGDYMVTDLPGAGLCNLYYWYYATLSLYQLQGPNWERWNEAVRKTLVTRQTKEGPNAGCWEGDDLWGCHGGRMYSTALATLTLEVYYRYLPLYSGVSTAKKPSLDRRVR